mmetsp:Transcript_14230/g.31934  ORF Transcript_14230/g.31934 Transcript_14230/m.31934 type:complete len:84 (+) Transcript_14230:2-253(+)
MKASLRRGQVFGNTHCGTADSTGQASFSCSGFANTPAVITVDHGVQFQTILGFGGAFTEATALNFYRLPATVQSRVLQMYFGA